MTTQQISYFLALSDELHYWRTSYKMNITQSALSRQIKALEDELRVELFKRTNRKVELTAAGKFLKQQWKPLVEQIDAAALYARKIHQGDGGRVVINHPGSVSYDVVPDLVGKISTAYPDIKVELVQLKHSQEEEMMKTFELDLSYTRFLHKADFITGKFIRQDSLALVVPQEYAIQTADELSFDTLNSQRFILSTLTEGESYHSAMNEIFSTYGIQPNICFESDFGSTILSLVEKGIGISIMPFAYSFANHPNVRFIKIPFYVPLYLNWRKDEENSVIKNILELVL